jgi:hypothetical protein
MNNEQHQENTKYVQWQDGMYVMLDDLLCDYEKALVENSLRGSRWLVKSKHFRKEGNEVCIGVYGGTAGLWWGGYMQTKLTRSQALYIATGDTDI